MLGDDGEQEQHFLVDTGAYSTLRPHGGRMPYRDSVGAWQRFDSDSRTWVYISQFLVVAIQGEAASFGRDHEFYTDHVPEELELGLKASGASVDGFDGKYMLVTGLQQNGYPIWKQVAEDDSAGNHYLFSGLKGHWLIGEAQEMEDDFETDDGVFRSAKPHGGALPHQVDQWQRHDSTGRADWKEDDTGQHHFQALGADVAPFTQLGAMERLLEVSKATVAPLDDHALLPFQEVFSKVTATCAVCGVVYPPDTQFLSNLETGWNVCKSCADREQFQERVNAGVLKALASKGVGATTLAGYLTGRQIDTLHVAGGVDELGFKASLNSAKALVISSVDPGTWAGENMVNAGDEILEINGVEVHSMSPSDLQLAMTRRPADLVFARGQKKDLIFSPPRPVDKEPARTFGSPREGGGTQRDHRTSHRSRKDSTHSSARSSVFSAHSSMSGRSSYHSVHSRTDTDGSDHTKLRRSKAEKGQRSGDGKSVRSKSGRLLKPINEDNSRRSSSRRSGHHSVHSSSHRSSHHSVHSSSPRSSHHSVHSGSHRSSHHSVHSGSPRSSHHSVHSGSSRRAAGGPIEQSLTALTDQSGSLTPLTDYSSTPSSTPRVSDDGTTTSGAEEDPAGGRKNSK
jgi:hypothetical protein